MSLTSLADSSEAVFTHAALTYVSSTGVRVVERANVTTEAFEMITFTALPESGNVYAPAKLKGARAVPARGYSAAQRCSSESSDPPEPP